MTIRTIAFFVFDRFQLLDVTGPASVFGVANSQLGRIAYDITLISARGGLVASSCGIRTDTQAVSEVDSRAVSALLVSGGDRRALREAAGDPTATRWLVQTARQAERYGSICSGAFLLGALGLLDGSQVATHWASCRDLARELPTVQVDENALFVRDGRLWTSAGVSTGIDMSLAMIEQDWGRPVADRIAKFMVLYLRRPGYQSQFSQLLQLQSGNRGDFAELIYWMQSNLTARLDVSDLAERAGMSERTLHRRFLERTGQTPARYVQRLRLDAARSLLATSLPLKTIAAKTGLGSASVFSKAFEQQFGVSPTLFRTMHTDPERTSPRQAARRTPDSAHDGSPAAAALRSEPGVP